MPDRADYLARTLLTRSKELTALLEPKLPAGSIEASRQKEQMVLKVLAVETGVTDGVTVTRVAAALPNPRSQNEVSGRDLNEYAEFLRRTLPLE